MQKHSGGRKGQGTRVKGQGSRDKGQESRVKGARTKADGLGLIKPLC